MVGEYTAEEIQILGDMPAIRKRPAMYIGDTGVRGLHHLIYEVVDNSIDEALAGFCKNIEIAIEKDNSVSVADDGRGIPVAIHPEVNKSALEVVLTMLHAGGKFDKKSYKVSGGLHGVGVSVVNALSEWLEADVKRDGKLYRIRCERGVPVGKVEEIGKSEGTGATVRFKPDKEIFPLIDFSYDIIEKRMRELAFLNKGLRIALLDKRSGQSEEFRYEGGIVKFVEYLNRNKNVLHRPIYIEGKNEDTEVEVAIQYNDTYTENVYSFANNINTIEGGFHLVGFKTALTRLGNDYAKGNNLLKVERLSGDDFKEGLVAVINIRLQNPQFEGQTKTKLGNSELKGIVDSVVYEKLKSFFEENPHDARRIIEKALSAAEARTAAKKAKELIRRKSAFETSVLPGKLADCSEMDPELTEIYIVEGDSAGGCFSGDTKVALVDGRNLSFRDLVEEDKKGKVNYCYTINEDGTIGISLIKNPRMTKKDAEVIKVILDNNEEIVCTPDHNFMLRNGDYTEANSIKMDTSLMPLNRKLSKVEKRITIKNYEMVYDPRVDKWIFTHLLADRYNIENGKYESSLGDYRHHIDFNRLNNNPENIVRMTKDAHLRLHQKMVEKTLLREDTKQSAREAHKIPAYKEKIKEIMSTPEMKRMLSERAQKQWENEEYKEYMIKKYLEFYENNKEYRERSLEILNKAQTEYWSNEENKRLQSERTRRYFEGHSEQKKILSEIAKEQWNDSELKEWRSKKTKEQWTKEFRERRKRAYNRTYFNYTIAFVRQILDNQGNLEQYDKERVKSRNRNLLKKETFIKRFFDGDENAMMEAVRNYNHKIKEIIRLNQKMDVYDLEVEGTHNFALGAGVFVHNSGKQGRDRRFQAILPLKGKILNVEKARITKILANEEIRSLIMALGTSFGDDFDISKARYHKIIIMTDADVDGAHIRTLLLTFFYRHARPLIQRGYIYIAQPPLYRIKKGKTERYAYNDNEMKGVVKELGEGVTMQRYKGLGEMNPSQLWDTTMNPNNRTLLKVTIEDAIKADELFTILMGDAVEPRKLFIEAHAKEVQNLDI